MNRRTVNTRRSRFNRSTTTGSMASAVFNVKDMNSMHQSLNSEFMLYQLILKHILTTSDNKKSVAEDGLLKYFQPEEEEDQKTFKEFDNTYKSKAAIHWYTRETCVYRMLNRALRTHNTKHLLGFNVLMRDLNEQLTEEQKPFLKKFKVPEFQVYRGQYISKDEVNRIKSGIGQLLAMNSFLSTSTNFKKAMEFATSKPPPSDTLTSILLEITVSVSTSTRPFADIKHLSAFPSEEEILFMFGNIFRIDNIWEDTKRNIWRAKFTLCNETDEDYRAFMKALQKDVGDRDQLVTLGHYMLEMENFEEAELHYRTLLEGKLVERDHSLASCHHGLARVYTKKGDYDLAIDNIETALKYLSKESSKMNDALKAQCYNDYGSIYCKKGEIMLTFQYYEKALRIDENTKAITYAGLSEIHVQLGDYCQALEFQHKRLETLSQKENCQIAATYIDIGKIYGLMNDSKRSTEMFDKAIKIQMKTLYDGHPDLGYSYNGVALMYFDVGDFDAALKYLNKAFALQTKSLPNNHTDFCETYRNFGNLYLKEKDLDKALFYYKKLLDCQIMTLSPTHPSVSDTEVLIGRVYLEKEDYKESLVYYKRSLDSQLERKPFGDSSLSAMYKQIAEINMKAQDLDEALEYYHKILDNDLERKVIEDKSFVETYRIMGDIYCKKGDLHQGLFYYYRLLDCQLQARPFKEAAVIETYELIGELYMEKPCDQTLLNFNESLGDHMSNNSSSNVALLDDHIVIGNSHFEKRHLDQALFYFKKMYDCQMQKGSSDDKSLIETLKILGNISTDRNEFDQASIYMTQLLRIELTRKDLDDPSLINIYKTMGKVYFEKCDFDKALAYYNRLVDVQLHRKSSNDSIISETCMKIGKIYLIKPFSKQLTVFNILLQRKIEHNQSTSRSIIDIPEVMGDEEFEQRHFDRVFHYFEQLIIISEHDESLPNAIQRADVYRILGNIAIEKHDWSLALLYYDRLRKETFDDSFTLIDIYKTIGTILYQQNDLHQALVYYQKALNDELSGKSIQDSSLSVLFKVMATIYYKLNNLPSALIHFNRLLDCQTHVKPVEESSIDSTYKWISKIYAKKPYDESFLYFTRDSSKSRRISTTMKTYINSDYVIVNNCNFEIRHLDEALKYFQQKLEDRSQLSRSALVRLYTILVNISLEKTDFDLALKYLHEVLEMAIKTAPADNPTHQTTYKMMATIYCKKQDFNRALYYVNQWLDCLFKVDTSNNASKTQAYTTMGEIFLIEHTFDHLMHSISEFYEKNPGSRLSKSNLNNLVQKVYSEQRHLQRGINFFRNLLLNQSPQPLKQGSSWVKMLNILRNMYLHKREFKEGLIFFQQLLQDHLRNSRDPGIIAANIYESVGSLNAELGEKHKAVFNYQKSLEIYERNLPSNSIPIQKIKTEIRNLLTSQDTFKSKIQV